MQRLTYIFKIHKRPEEENWFTLDIKPPNEFNPSNGEITMSGDYIFKEKFITRELAERYGRQYLEKNGIDIKSINIEIKGK